MDLVTQLLTVLVPAAAGGFAAWCVDQENSSDECASERSSGSSADGLMASREVVL